MTIAFIIIESNIRGRWVGILPGIVPYAFFIWHDMMMFDTAHITAHIAMRIDSWSVDRLINPA